MHTDRHQVGRQAEADSRPAPEQARLLVVDDDAELRELAEAYLTQQGYQVDTVADGREMDKALFATHYDLILLDLMMPGEDGLTIAKRLKASHNLPIIMVSAQGEDIDRIVGLEVGADDYIAKPFNPRELLARIRAVLRRAAQSQPAAAPAAEVARDQYRFGDFELDVAAHRLNRHGEPLALTSGEFELLTVLVQHPNRVLDRDRILDLLTGAERSPFDRSIDVRVTRLRSKIEPDPSSPIYIRTVWGKGYMFCPEGEA
jgi:two-component system, OmpR family, phosphate regulon response regulator OmpR